MSDVVASFLATNIKQLREAQGLTQDKCSRISGVPRPTWANLESGAATPPLAVIVKVAAALQVSVEELISAPKASCRLYKAGTLPTRTRGGVKVRELLPDSIVGLEIERLELDPDANLKGVPHTPGTREYLVGERGQIDLVVSGDVWSLEPGDVLVFRGDQTHSYRNRTRKKALAYSVIVLSSGGPI